MPHGHWKTTTFTGALRTVGLTAPFVHDGAMNGAVFQTYVNQMLVPTLLSGDIVILDNLPAHWMPGARRAVEQAGASMMFLPPYSPDCNPIEMAFSKLKFLMWSRGTHPHGTLGCRRRRPPGFHANRVGQLLHRRRI